MILLDADVIKAIFSLLLFILAYPIYGSIAAFIFKQKVRMHGRGVIGHPETIPNIAKFISGTTKEIYDKIGARTGNNKLDALRSTTDKMAQLKQLGELKEKGVINEDEFKTLKEEVLRTTLDSSKADLDAQALRAGGRVNRKFGQR